MNKDDIHKSHEFIASLLNRVENVYYSNVDKRFDFYIKELKFSVEIPMSYGNAVDIIFYQTKKLPDSRREVKQQVICSFAHYSEISHFLELLYDKYRQRCNHEYQGHHLEAASHRQIVQDILQQSPQALPYAMHGDSNQLTISLTGKRRGEIYLGRALFDYEHPKSLYSLQPVHIAHSINGENSSSQLYMEYIIPAYKIPQYPLLAQHQAFQPQPDSFSQLIDHLSNVFEDNAHFRKYHLEQNLPQQELLKRKAKV